MSTQLLYGQSASHYREFQLGGDLATVSAVSGVAVSKAKVIHQRSAVMQDLLPILPTERWFDNHEAVAALPELLNQEA